MPLTKRTIASRANGAKSKGPKTEAGKRRSCANSYRHGFLSEGIILCNEDLDTFTALSDQYLAKFRPTDDVELGIVEEMIACQWRLRRLWCIESELMNQGIRRSNANTSPARSAESFSKLGAAAELQLLDRYETRMHRMYHRALNNLISLRQFSSETEDSEAREDVVLPNEPTPEQTMSTQGDEIPLKSSIDDEEEEDPSFDPYNPPDIRPLTEPASENSRAESEPLPSLA